MLHLNKRYVAPEWCLDKFVKSCFQYEHVGLYIHPPQISNPAPLQRMFGHWCWLDDNRYLVLSIRKSNVNRSALNLDITHVQWDNFHILYSQLLVNRFRRWVAVNGILLTGLLSYRPFIPKRANTVYLKTIVSVAKCCEIAGWILCPVLFFWQLL